MQAVIKQLKNRKSPGQDGLINELLKYGGESLAMQLTTLIKKIVSHQKIPDDWTILMFKKGVKNIPTNYRGINLLGRTLKLATKVITNKINSLITSNRDLDREGRGPIPQ
ncbi:uncharacterized protein LOC130900571 [Diorhabda carinulata]|uniref:uncharacterized protein LOC130900571 n=1 Tax=Diorhabda carinulata TaxID=1163345 RepID=UPI0025A0B864|nr:uncharacterized protein LOC130900571 [Diorhabda carinulata]